MGKVMNVILANDADRNDDDEEEFLVEEKPKDDLDLKTEDYCSTLRDETLEAASRFKELIQQKAMI